MTRCRLRGTPYLLAVLDAYVAAGDYKGAAAMLGRSIRSVERSMAKLRDINGGMPTPRLCALRGVRRAAATPPPHQEVLWRAA